MITIIDYGLGNIQAFVNLYRRLDIGVRVARTSEDVTSAERIILPGVGAFDHAMELLQGSGMRESLDAVVTAAQVPVLGICVGMQLLADAGEEHGTHAGLRWIGGTVRAFDPVPGLRIPHMGWNDVVPSFAHPVIAAGEAYYLHGYHFADAVDVAATSSHGATFAAAVAKDNIVGVQYHPEKSQAYGLATLERFLQWRP